MKHLYKIILLSSVVCFSSCDDSKREINEVPIIFPIDSVHNEVDTLAKEIGANKSYSSIDYAQVSAEINDTSRMAFYNRDCAISIIPDVKWIDQQQKQNPESWDAVVDDNQYYQSLATDTLKRMKITVLSHDRSKRYLRFKLANGIKYTLDCEKMPDAWGLILYNGTDKPVLWLGTDAVDVKSFF